MTRAQFDPPSDFVDKPSGGGKRTWLKVLGVGCAGGILIVGILGALGVFKMVSCCSAIKDVGVNASKAQQRAASFGEAMAASDWQEMHGLLTSAYAQEMSPEALEGAFEPYAQTLKNCTPIESTLALGQEVGSLKEAQHVKRWEVDVRCFPRAGASKRVVVAEVQIELISGEADKDAAMGISQIRVSDEEIFLPNEEPVQAVKELHGALQAENAELAWMKLAPSMQDEQGREGFDAFIEGQGDLFVKSTIDVRELTYADSEHAQVVAMLTSASGRKAVVTYGLQSEIGVWRVHAISPLIETVPQPAAQEDVKEANREANKEAGEAAPVP